jgi:hypothetical protein
LRKLLLKKERVVVVVVRQVGIIMECCYTMKALSNPVTFE